MFIKVNFKNFKAFSLIELMITLITISCIIAAFTPVISKRLKSSNVTIKGNNVSDITTNCSDKFSNSCKLCTKSYCIQCDLSNCTTGTYAESKSCTCKDCSTLYSNCIECDSNKCTKCKDNNYYINNGKCEICPSNKICDGINAYDKTYCTNPPAGYFCEGNTIKRCSDKYGATCVTCNVNSCLSCDVKYFLSNGSCKRCAHAGCTSCLSANYCLSCEETWVYDSVNHTCSNVCSAYMPNCIHCLSANKCTRCAGGYYVNTSGSCASCSVISNCIYCSSSTKCEQCASGYYVNSSGQCSVCTVPNCVQCGDNGLCSVCASGYYLSEDKKSCIVNDSVFNCSDSNFMRIGNLCVTRKNMGDSPTLVIPSSVNVVQAPIEYCYSQTNKCCWKGVTSNDCDSANGDYSGCNRTVCAYNVAEEICSKFNYAGKTWRLATTSEMANWINYSRTLKNNGLMLCDETSSSFANSKCFYWDAKCLGSYINICYSQNVAAKNNYGYTLFSSFWYQIPLSPYIPVSVRCVTEMDTE